MFFGLDMNKVWFLGCSYTIIWYKRHFNGIIIDPSSEDKRAQGILKIFIVD